FQWEDRLPTAPPWGPTELCMQVRGMGTYTQSGPIFPPPIGHSRQEGKFVEGLPLVLMEQFTLALEVDTSLRSSRTAAKSGDLKQMARFGRCPLQLHAQSTLDLLITICMLSIPQQELNYGISRPEILSVTVPQS